MASVIGKNEILLNSERYSISGPVRKTLVSIAAPRFTIGDTQHRLLELSSQLPNLLLGLVQMCTLSIPTTRFTSI